MHQEPLALNLKPAWALKSKGNTTANASFKGDPQDQRISLRPAALDQQHSKAATNRAPSNSSQLAGPPLAAPRSSYFSSSSREAQQGSASSWKQNSGSSTPAAALSGSSSPRSSVLHSALVGDSTRDEENFSRPKATSGSGGSAQDKANPSNRQLSSPPPDNKRQPSGGSATWYHGANLDVRPQRVFTSALVHDDLKPVGSGAAQHPPSSPSTGQAVYKKVVFEKEFPSLKDSKHPLGYAPKEAPYKQTFLSSRGSETWTSKLADVPPQVAQASDPDVPAWEQPAAAAGQGQQASAARFSSGEAAAGTARPDRTPAVAAGLTASVSAVVSAVVPGPSATNGSSSAAPASGWGSFAHAAGTTPGNSANGTANGSTGVNSVSTDKLREQLAVKQSKQLIPVLARKDDSSASGSGRGRPGISGKAGQASLQAGKAAGSVLPGSSKQLLLGSSTMLSNGTITLTKKKFNPLDRPLVVAGAASPSGPDASREAGAPLLLLKTTKVAALITPKPQAAQTDGAEPTQQQEQQQQHPTKDAAANLETPWLCSPSGPVFPLCHEPPALSSNQDIHDPAPVPAYEEQAAVGRVPALCSPGHSDSNLAALHGMSDQQQQQLEQQRMEQLEQLELLSYLPGDLLGAVSVQGVQQLEQLSSYLPGDLLVPVSASTTKQQQPDIPSGAANSYSNGLLLGAHLGAEAAYQQQQPGSQQQQQQPKFLVSSEEEAFLRSLGWTDADDSTDDVLTEEEIAAFQAAAEARRGSSPPPPPPPVSHGPSSWTFATSGLAAKGPRHQAQHQPGALALGMSAPGFFGVKPVSMAMPIRGMAPGPVATKAGGAAAFSFGSDISMTDSEDM